MAARRRARSLRLLAHLLVLRPFLWAVFGVNVRGEEHLQNLDQFILVSNHNSHLDTLILYAALPWRQITHTRPVAASDYFAKHRWLFASVSFLFRPIWVDREGERGAALPDIQRALDRGENIILFPEGTRGEAGELQEFRGGIGRIVASNRSIPVIAAFLEGPERAFPRRASFPLPLWNHLTIAPPQHFAGASTDVTRSLQASLALLNEEARAARQRRGAAWRPVFTVAVLGTDGSGKSTLSERLARRLSGTERTCLISDRLTVYEGGQPFDMQPLMTETLRLWVGARAKRAENLSAYKVPKLAELLLRDRLSNDAGRWYRPSVVFMDGMPVLNLTAWAILYRGEHFTEEVCVKALSILTRGRREIARTDPIFRQFPELGGLRQLRLGRMALPDAVIFLDVSPAVCMDRIAARGERTQAHENLESLTKLRDAYRLVCQVVEREPQLPVLVMDGQKSLEELESEAADFVERTRQAWSPEHRIRGRVGLGRTAGASRGNAREREG